MEKAESTSIDSVPVARQDVKQSTEVSSVKDAGSTDQTVPSMTAMEYRKLIWKLDLHLLPPLFALWFVSLIDRINIGSANIFGLQKDLKMNPKSNQFNVALIIVLIGLITCEVPSNYLLKKTSPSKVLALESFILGEYLSRPHTNLNSFSGSTFHHRARVGYQLLWTTGNEILHWRL